MHKYLLFFTSILLISNELLAQKQTVHLITSNKQTAVGELITLTVKSSVGGTVTIDFPDQFEVGSGVMNGMEMETDYNTGTVRSLYYFSQNGTFKKEGSYTFKAYIKNKNTIFKSNSITIQVKKQANEPEEIKSKTIKELAFGVIEKSKNTIYEGEALVLNAKVYYRPELEIHNQFQYQSFELEKKAEVHEVGSSKGVYTSKENYKGQNFQTFTYGKQVIFPQALGKQQVIPFEMVLQYNDGGLFLENLPFRSSRTSFDVLPLPAGAPNNFCGGVGSFSLESAVNTSTVEAGDVLVYTLKIRGEGNLQQLETPKLTLPSGLELYGDPERTENFKVSSNGLEGHISIVYRLKCTKNGDVELPKCKISYFDPTAKKYLTSASKTHTIQVSGTYNLHVQSATPKQANAEDQVIKGEDETQKKTSTQKLPILLLSILSPVALGFIFLFLFRNKNKKEAGKPVVQPYDIIKNKTHIHAQFTQLQARFETLASEERVREINQLLQAILLFKLELNESELSTRELIQACKTCEKEVAVLEEIKKECEAASYSFECNRIIEGAFVKLEEEVKAL